MSEFPSLNLPDSFRKLLEKQPKEFWEESKKFSDSIEGVRPLVGPLKVTKFTVKTVDSNGKVESCIGVPCSKETCTCGYYEKPNLA